MLRRKLFKLDSLPPDSDRGQAMVEFVILLIILMALCTGMLVVVRLLTFQFWAQQEARFLAYEQTWASYAANHADPDGSAISKVADGAFIGRPQNVTNQPAAKSVNSDGTLQQLLSWLRRTSGGSDGEAEEKKPLGERTDSPVMFANNDNSLWTRRTTDWFRPGGIYDRATTLVDTAFASQEKGGELQTESLQTDDRPEYPMQGNYRDRLGPKIRTILAQIQFGPAVCGSLQSFSESRGSPPQLLSFAGADCAERMEADFSDHLAAGVDIQDFFRGYEENIRSGFDAGEALEISVREEVGSQFYSFFDTRVAAARADAPTEISDARTQAGVAMSDATVTKIVNDARYVGAKSAVNRIISAVGTISAESTASHNVANSQALDQNIVNMLHTEAEDTLPVLGPFSLSTDFLPVPPEFGSIAGGMQEAVIKNILSQPEDNDALDDNLNQSNREIEVTYPAANGLFREANRVRGAEEAKLTGKYYLITQPWHLERRRNHTGGYRDKGTETDGPGEDTEEGIMRRHLIGLWLFPVNIPAFIEPITNFAGLGFLTPAFDAIQPFADAVAFIKRGVVDNPFFDVAQVLSKIPGIGDIIPVPPRFPAVRPDAYPGSVELQGLNMNEPDKMILDAPREFKDYVDEQRDNNPDPNPTYN